MSKHRPNIKGYLKRHVDGDGQETLIVGAEDMSDPKCKYHGPRAEIIWDGDWLHIETDPYEGHVMLNIESLEHLRRALNEVSRKIRKTA